MELALTYVYTYILTVVICALVGLTVALHIDSDIGTRKERQALYYFLFSYMAFVLSNGVCAWCNYANIAVIGTIGTIINMASICVCVYHWFWYINTRIKQDGQSKRKRDLWISRIPLAVMFILLASSPISHLIFYYNEDGQFTRGPLYMSILAMSAIYLLIAMVMVLFRLPQVKGQSQRRQHQLLILFMVMPFCAGIIDFFVPHVPVMELLILVGLIVVFVNMQQSHIYTDALTGLNNRRRADEYLKDQLSQASKKHPIIFFLADVDSFKSINDEHGHLEGDQALCVVADTLRRYMNQYRGHVSRWGGDEFVIVADALVIPDPSEVIKKINESLATRVQEDGLAYPLHLSVGYSISRHPGTESSEIMEQADRMMYQKKRENREQ